MTEQRRVIAVCVRICDNPAAEGSTEGTAIDSRISIETVYDGSSV